MDAAGCVSSRIQSLAEAAPVESMGQLSTPSPGAKSGPDLATTTQATTTEYVLASYCIIAYSSHYFGMKSFQVEAESGPRAALTMVGSQSVTSNLPWWW